MKYNLALIDNYDSFTYNLLHSLLITDTVNVDVFFNNQVVINSLSKYDALVFSPGPGLPSEAGLMPAIIRQYINTKPMLGICLGHQAIAEAFGVKLCHAPILFHGQATPIKVIDSNDYVFHTIPSTFMGGRYHSWIIENKSLPDELRITAVDEHQHIMALRHKTLPITGLQFHPESILTPEGDKIIANWIHQALRNTIG